MENGILTHPVLGELELRTNVRARRFSFRSITVITLEMISNE